MLASTKYLTSSAWASCIGRGQVLYILFASMYSILLEFEHIKAVIRKVTFAKQASSVLNLVPSPT